MLLVDREIKQLIDDNVLVGADINNISNICYDLCSSRFFSSDTKMMTSCDLMPGETVFVESRERIHLKNDMIAKIVLRNSRIRQGLSLEAPIYQPGHYTKIYFRITNISKCKINLDTNNGIASIMFEKLSHDVDRPYHGTFQDEFNFSGMGDYESSYRSAMQDLEHKADEVKNIEKKLYSNVINLMVIFIGIFSLININIQMAVSQSVDISKFLIFNLTTVGSVALLSALIHSIEGSAEDNKRVRLQKVFEWIAAVICFIISFAIYIFG